MDKGKDYGNVADYHYDVLNRLGRRAWVQMNDHVTAIYSSIAWTNK